MCFPCVWTHYLVQSLLPVSPEDLSTADLIQRLPTSSDHSRQETQSAALSLSPNPFLSATPAGFGKLAFMQCGHTSLFPLSLFETKIILVTCYNLNICC